MTPESYAKIMDTLFATQNLLATLKRDNWGSDSPKLKAIIDLDKRVADAIESQKGGQ